MVLARRISPSISCHLLYKSGQIVSRCVPRQINLDASHLNAYLRRPLQGHFFRVVPAASFCSRRRCDLDRTISCLARTSPASSSRRAFCQRMKANTRSLFQCTMPVCSSRCGRTPAADQGSAAFLVPDIDCSFLPPVRLLRLLILCLIFSQIGLFLQSGDYGAVTFNQVF